MNGKDKEFMAEAYSLIVQIEELIKQYGYEDRVMSAIVLGLLDIDVENEPEEGDQIQLKSVFSYNLEGALELELIKDIMSQQFDEGDGLDELLGDLGISLN